jgi:hypothetical protein
MRFCILFSILTLSCTSYGQRVLRIFIGTNISNTDFHFVNTSTGFDSSGLRINNYVLPLMGADIAFTINRKLSITSGMGLSWMGSRNYHKGAPALFNIDPDLRLGYLRFPLIFNFELFHSLNIAVGYSFNYNFRKNQQFLTYNDQTLKIINIYKPFHHAINIGLSKDIGNFNILVNYQKGLSRIFDTKEINHDYRAYLTLGGLQLSLGYLIKE